MFGKKTYNTCMLNTLLLNNNSTITIQMMMMMMIFLGHYFVKFGLDSVTFQNLSHTSLPKPKSRPPTRRNTMVNLDLQL